MAQADQLKNATVIFVLGGPGSGKGTQCERIASKYGLTHLSSGDLLRHEASNGTERGKRLQSAMLTGGLVPPDAVLELMRDAMYARAASSQGFLIDGYPRELEQSVRFEAQLAPCRAVLFLDVSESVMRERLLKRAQTSGRVDDNKETIEKRFKTFEEHTKPVIEHFQKQGKLIKIDASGSADEIFKAVQEALDRLNLKVKA